MTRKHFILNFHYLLCPILPPSHTTHNSLSLSISLALAVISVFLRSLNFEIFLDSIDFYKLQQQRRRRRWRSKKKKTQYAEMSVHEAQTGCPTEQRNDEKSLFFHVHVTAINFHCSLIHYRLENRSHLQLNAGRRAHCSRLTIATYYVFIRANETHATGATLLCYAEAVRRTRTIDAVRSVPVCYTVDGDACTFFALHQLNKISVLPFLFLFVCCSRDHVLAAFQHVENENSAHAREPFFNLN